MYAAVSFPPSLPPTAVVTRDADITSPLGARRGIVTQIEVREHETGSHSVLLVNTLDRPGLLTGELTVVGVGGLREGLLGLGSAKGCSAASVSGRGEAQAAVAGWERGAWRQDG